MALKSKEFYQKNSSGKTQLLGAAENFTFDPIRHDGLVLTVPTSYSGTIVTSGMTEGSSLTLLLQTEIDPASWVDYPSLPAGVYMASGKFEIVKTNGIRYGNVVAESGGGQVYEILDLGVFSESATLNVTTNQIAGITMITLEAQASSVVINLPAGIASGREFYIRNTGTEDASLQVATVSAGTLTASTTSHYIVWC